MVLVSPELGVDSLNRLVELARERATPLAFPSQGEGSSPHLQSERLARRLGFKALHVTYKERPMSDLAAGRLDFAVQPSPRPWIVVVVRRAATTSQGSRVTSPAHFPRARGRVVGRQ